MANYKEHADYVAYPNGGVRPDERLLPEIRTNVDGRPFINPGEVYCRYRYADAQLCSETLKFSSESALRNQYKNAHDLVA
ncbi:unnamed protein product [Fusarium equiseti]|uniref:Uncharacterized protein n=1 Tax=Fusarium equiseti TaxID=61235 RepID=A0A8J2N7F3_FUSEQ|nr:unnamed protein product [Fusarium equiseti]